MKAELAKNLDTQQSLEKKLGDSLRKNEKFSSYKTPIGDHSQRSRSQLNDSAEGSLFDRDEDATDINISQSLGLHGSLSKKPPKDASFKKKQGGPNLDETLGQTREDLLDSSMVQDDLMYSSAGNTQLNFQFTKTEGH